MAVLVYSLVRRHMKRTTHEGTWPSSRRPRAQCGSARRWKVGYPKQSDACRRAWSKPSACVTIDAGDSGHNKMQLLRDAGLSGPVEDAVMRCK